MLDFSWPELLVIIVIAVMVIGPKEIPQLMYGLGRVVKRVQYLRFALFQQFEELMKDAELEALRKEVDVSGSLDGDISEIAVDAGDEVEADADALFDEEMVEVAKVDGKKSNGEAV